MIILSMEGKGCQIIYFFSFIEPEHKKVNSSGNTVVFIHLRPVSWSPFLESPGSLAYAADATQLR